MNGLHWSVQSFDGFEIGRFSDYDEAVKFADLEWWDQYRAGGSQELEELIENEAWIYVNCIETKETDAVVSRSGKVQKYRID